MLSKEELEVSEEEVSESPKKIEKDIKFSYFEPIAGIIFAVVAAVIFLGFPQIIAVVFTSGALIPTFDAEVIRSLWIPIVLWALFRIAVEAFYLVEHRYTKRLAIATMIGNGIAFICTLIIFIPYRIVFIEYINWINTQYEGAAWFREIIIRPNIVIIVIMLIGLILDSITVIRKGFKKKKVEEDDEDEEDEVEAETINIDDEAEKAEEVRVEAE